MMMVDHLGKKEEGKIMGRKEKKERKWLNVSYHHHK
jgi:hypothetical protein